MSQDLKKELIDEKIRLCVRHKRIDNILIFLSAIFTTTICALAYHSNSVLLVFFLIVGWIINLAVMFYCQRVWSLRINRWEALWKWCDLVDHVTLLGVKLPSLSKSEGITAEILQRLPISNQP